MDSDFEKPTGEQSETRLMLLLSVLLISCAFHVGLMYVCSDYAFSPLPADRASSHLWKKDLPPMQVHKMAEDPLSKAFETELPRPAAAPDAERQEDRVERLAASEGSSLSPEMPRAATTEPIADAQSEPTQIAAAEWQPRQEILAIEAPVVPDDQAALPRLEIPKLARVPNAPDVSPAFDFSSAVPRGPSGTGQGVTDLRTVSLVDAAEAVSASTAIPAPPAPTGLPVGVQPSASAGLGGTPPSLTVLSAAEESAAKKAADDARAAEKAALAADRRQEAERASRTVPPAPKTTLVDEKVVQKEKEAVRALRDETTPQGKPFEEHVKMGLGYWVDPARPKFKYFRVVVSSRSEKPLPVISKDIVFLVDASGSIANDRLKKIRRAVSKALRLLNTGDRFNVVAFRDKFAFAFPEVAWRDVSEKSLDEADDWLSTLTAHGQTDVFRTLRGVLAMPRDPARPVVAFVITDGEATSGLTRSAEIISRFSDLNGGLISIYMYGVKDNANAYLMDMLTRGNRGSWSRNEKLRWNAADGIPELAKKFERPVLTDVSVLFSASSRAETYPELVTNLCEDEPIEIFGVCPADQKEIVLSLRGLNAATVFENVFRLSFSNAQKLGPEVRADWAQRKLYALIAAYTKRPDGNLLRDMRIFAKSFNVQIPYEKEIR